MTEDLRVEKMRVVLSNYWHRPGITIKLIHDREDAPNGAVEMSISLIDFLQALFVELGEPEMEHQFARAIGNTLNKVKEASVGNVH